MSPARQSRARGAQTVTPALLRRLAPPTPDAAGDKDARGRVLAVGGSMQVPGALLLSGVAALRAGAGKLQLATTRAVAGALGVAVPEAMVVGLPASRAGEIAGSRAATVLAPLASKANAVLVGPGMSDPRAAHALVAALVRRMDEEAVLVVDAAAITGLRDDTGAFAGLDGRVVLTPHAGEMATLLDVEKDEVEAEPARMARAAAQRFGATVALKGPESWIAEPDGTLYHYAGGTVGLATSGSGDTLAGIVAGLAARGTPAAHAAVWGAYLHGAAGRALARRIGPIGFLARELLDEIPAIMWKLSRQ
jgi:ADP-dependent NAD(P)H-hydrate dehydratase